MKWSEPIHWVLHSIMIWANILIHKAIHKNNERWPSVNLDLLPRQWVLFNYIHTIIIVLHHTIQMIDFDWYDVIFLFYFFVWKSSLICHLWIAVNTIFKRTGSAPRAHFKIHLISRERTVPWTTVTKDELQFVAFIFQVYRGINIK